MSVALRSALVTGCTGFLGSALVDRLLTNNIEVTCLVRSQSLAKSVQLADRPGVHLLEYGDSSNFSSSLSGVSAEVIFHLASYGVREADRDFDELIEGNISILVYLLRAVADWPLRLFVHTGSCSEYGPTPEGALIPETQPIAPATLYGAAKASSVLVGNALAATLKIPFATLRLFGAFGTREGSHRLVPYMISRLLNDQAVDLTGGAQVRDFLFEDDVTDAFLAAATSGGLESGKAYNVCSSHPTRIRDIGNLLVNLMDKPRELLHWGERPYRSGEPMWLVGDNRRFCEAANWTPSVTLQSGLEKMVEHARESRKRGEPVHGV